jgi:hypothetical protein
VYGGRQPWRRACVGATTHLGLEAAHCASQRGVEAQSAERLEDVVERVHVEGTQRVFVVRGDENHASRNIIAEHLQYVEPIAFGHLGVEEEQIGSESADHVDGLLPVTCFANDRDGWLVGEKSGQDGARGRLIIRNNGAERSNRLRHAKSRS